MIRIMQINMNHSSGAQELALHQISELNVDIGCFSEPWRVPEQNSNWFYSTGRRSAIFCNSSNVRKKCSGVASSEDWVAVEMGDIIIISCYLSPNEGIKRYNAILKEIGNFIANRGNKILVCGDFNAKSVAWGCNKDDRRGILLEQWASESDLAICNKGDTPTCVRPQGSSVVDLTFASTWVAARVKNWRVNSEMETLSDHLSVTFSLEVGFVLANCGNRYPRWSRSKFDKEMFKEVIYWRLDCIDSQANNNGNRMAKWIESTLTMACDCASIRLGVNIRSKGRYW